MKMREGNQFFDEMGAFKRGGLGCVGFDGETTALSRLEALRSPN